MTLLSVRNIAVEFNQHVLFENISFNLEDQQIFLVRGENGVGKTSLIRGLLKPKLFCKGDVQWLIPKKDVTYIPQLINLDLHMPFTLKDVVLTSGVFSEAEILEIGLLEERNLPLHWSQASGGEKKKALLTRAFLEKPKVLIVDEPFNYLDVKSRDQVQKLFYQLLSLSASIILITHLELSAEIFNNTSIKKINLPGN